MLKRLFGLVLSILIVTIIYCTGLYSMGAGYLTGWILGGISVFMCIGIYDMFWRD